MKATDESGMTEAEFLATYKRKQYPKPALTADIAVFRKRGSSSLEILLVQRGGHPFLGFWALPGGFVGPDEDADEAAERELQEETGLTRLSLEQLGVYSAPGRDPRGWTVSAAYLALTDEPQHARASDDAADARWFSLVENVDENVCVLSLACGETVLNLSFTTRSQTFSAPRAQIEASSALAFDHAQIIADAYLRLRDS